VSTRIIREFMTAEPVRIPRDMPLEAAHALMRSARVRHLVVTDGARLVGVLSQRDVYLMETLRGAEPEKASAEEAMVGTPYAVPADAPVAGVARAMWEQRIGSAVVLEAGEVVGIFTRTDALRALAEVLSGLSHPGAPDAEEAAELSD
jgi:acetoin utilization protein AcuB